MRDLVTRFRSTCGRRVAAWRKAPPGLLADPGQPHPLEPARAPLGLALLPYWLSVLHKLNYDFVDPDTSCASYMDQRVADSLPLLHLFMPRLVSLTRYQDDLVEILDPDDPELAELSQRQLLLPYFELRRQVSAPRT